MSRTRWALMALALVAGVAVAAAMGLRSRVRTSKVNVWSIGIYTGSSPYDFSEPEGVRNPVVTAEDVSDVEATFVADPFMMRVDGAWFMFFEVLNRRTNQGDIGMASSTDGFSWQYRRIVVDEPFHLSYPFIFEEGGVRYMVPESQEADQLRLYRAVDFPEKWEVDRVLLEGRFADHALFKRDNTWWLLAGSDPKQHRSLRLFFADSLKGLWTEHPSSPIVERDANMARPGGRALAFHDRVIRYAQDCEPTYGKELKAFDIVNLTRTSYAEKPAQVNPVLRPGKQSWRRHGMHQLDAHEIGAGKWMACVDGYRRDFVVKFEY